MEIPIYLLVAITFGLLVLTIMVFVSSIVIRLRFKRWERQIKKYNKQLMPVILKYVEEGGSLQDVEKQFHDEKLEYYTFEKIVTKMLTLVEGTEADRLQKLLNLDPIFDHQYKLLKSKDNVDRIKACNYFSNISLMDQEVIAILNEYLNSSNLFLAFAAGTALMGSKDLKVRAEALRKLARRKRMTEMALVELFHKFSLDDDDQRAEEEEAMKEILDDHAISARNRALLIKGVSEAGFYGLVDFLLDKLKSDEPLWNEPPVLSALIKAQGMFSNIASIETLREYLESHHHPVVLTAAIKELGDYGDDPDIEKFYNLCEHENGKVQKAAVYGLMLNGVDRDTIELKISKEAYAEIEKYVQTYESEELA